jgi:hypothetical protein
MTATQRPAWRELFSGQRLLLGILILIAALGAGCASYRVPGGPADFRAMGITQAQADQQTDWSIAKRLDRQPLAKFPTSIAIVRVQGPGYCSHTTRSYGSGRYSIITTRDVESDEAFKRLAALPMVAGLAPINRLVVSPNMDTEENLREAAATVQADMVLVYTFDTVFGNEKKIAPLGLITLGLFPDREARVTSTASAVLLDTRNGYVYGLAEATGKDNRIANAWTSKSAVDASRRTAEKAAFEGLVGEVETMWRGVVERFTPAKTAASTG